MKKYIILGHIYFAILIIFSVIFYLERTLYVDSAYQIYELINTKTFHINDSRFSMFLSELLPLSVIYLNLPLKVVVLSYSLSFILIFYSIYIFVVHKLKNPQAGILIVLIILGIRHTFFHTISETFQILTFASFFFAWLYYPLKIENKKINIAISLAVSLILVALCFFIHPITLFVIPFIIGYYVIDQKKWTDYKIYLVVLLFLLLYVIKFLTIKENTREGGFVSQLLNISETLPNLFQYYSTRYPYYHFTKIYLLPTIILLIVTIFYIYKKKFLKLAYLYGFGTIFLMISVIVYSEGGSNIEMERTFMPLIFFITIPFINEVIVEFKELKKIDYINFGFIVILLLVSFFGIYNTSKKYTIRFESMVSLLEKTDRIEGEKFAMESATGNDLELMAKWDFAMETLLYSSLQGKDYSKTIFITEKFSDIPENLFQKDSLFFAVPWMVGWSANNLNPTYFNLPKQKYQQIIYDYSPIFLCNAETLNESKDKMTSEITEGILFENAKIRSSKNSFSGDWSVKLDKDNTFGFSSKIKNVLVNEKYKVTAKRLYSGESFIVVANEETKFYIQGNTASEIVGSDWELLEIEFTIPKKLNNKDIKCYIWNAKQDSVYYDDFIVSKGLFMKKM